MFHPLNVLHRHLFRQVWSDRALFRLFKIISVFSQHFFHTPFCYGPRDTLKIWQMKKLQTVEREMLEYSSTMQCLDVLPCHDSIMVILILWRLIFCIYIFLNIKSCMTVPLPDQRPPVMYSCGRNPQAMSIFGKSSELATNQPTH